MKAEDREKELDSLCSDWTTGELPPQTTLTQRVAQQLPQDISQDCERLRGERIVIGNASQENEQSEESNDSMKLFERKSENELTVEQPARHTSSYGGSGIFSAPSDADNTAPSSADWLSHASTVFASIFGISIFFLVLFFALSTDFFSPNFPQEAKRWMSQPAKPLSATWADFIERISANKHQTDSSLPLVKPETKKEPKDKPISKKAKNSSAPRAKLTTANNSKNAPAGDKIQMTESSGVRILSIPD